MIKHLSNLNTFIFEYIYKIFSSKNFNTPPTCWQAKAWLAFGFFLKEAITLLRSGVLNIWLLNDTQKRVNHNLTNRIGLKCYIETYFGYPKVGRDPPVVKHRFRSFRKIVFYGMDNLIFFSFEQEENVLMQQRLQMLEHSSAAMADDLLNKSKLIQHYCMEGKSG